MSRRYRNTGRPRNQTEAMYRFGRTMVQATPANRRHAQWADLTYRQARDFLDRASESAGYDYPTDKGSVLAFMSGTADALLHGGSRRNGRRPARARRYVYDDACDCWVDQKTGLAGPNAPAGGRPVGPFTRRLADARRDARDAAMVADYEARRDWKESRMGRQWAANPRRRRRNGAVAAAAARAAASIAQKQGAAWLARFRAANSDQQRAMLRKLSHRGGLAALAAGPAGWLVHRLTRKARESDAAVEAVRQALADSSQTEAVAGVARKAVAANPKRRGRARKRQRNRRRNSRTRLFSVGETLILHSPHVRVDTPVQYRGRTGDNAVVILNGMQMTVPIAWLRHSTQSSGQSVEGRRRNAFERTSVPLTAREARLFRELSDWMVHGVRGDPSPYQGGHPDWVDRVLRQRRPTPADVRRFLKWAGRSGKGMDLFKFRAVDRDHDRPGVIAALDRYLGREDGEIALNRGLFANISSARKIYDMVRPYGYGVTGKDTGRVGRPFRKRRKNPSARSVRKALRAAGCYEQRQRGSHLTVACPDGQGVVPVHGGDVPRGTLRSIERQTGVRLRNARRNPATWAKLRDGSWGLRLTGAEARVSEGHPVTVRKRSGESSEVVVGPQVWSGRQGGDTVVLARAGRQTGGRSASTSGRSASASSRSAARPTRSGRPSESQLNYAENLIRRLGRMGWHDSDYGQDGSRPPTRSEMAKWSARDVSDLIDSLKGEF